MYSYTINIGQLWGNVSDHFTDYILITGKYNDKLNGASKVEKKILATQYWCFHQTNKQGVEYNRSYSPRDIRLKYTLIQ